MAKRKHHKSTKRRTVSNWGHDTQETHTDSVEHRNIRNIVRCWQNKYTEGPQKEVIEGISKLVFKTVNPNKKELLQAFDTAQKIINGRAE